MQPALTVYQLVALLREVIENHEFFSDIWVQGEISNLSRSGLGHRYFSLKDERALIRCVLFRDEIADLDLHEGDRVYAHGWVGVYVQRGELQFRPDFIRPEGIGILAARFEQLKQRLQEEGLFDAARKRPLARFPLRIGLVTSSSGAALHDVRTVLERRWPLATVLLAPAMVQGDQAPARITAALRRLAREPRLDLAIVARGGGSLEDLWPFNDESVARAIYAFPAPVVTGIGHETDVTIADLVADLRAPTPSAAAERSTPDIHEVRRAVALFDRGMASALGDSLARRKGALAASAHRLRQTEPPVVALERSLDSHARALARVLAHRLELEGRNTDHIAARLAALDPRAVLARGFAIVQKEGGRRPVVTSVRKVRGGDRLAVSVTDGAFWAEVS